MLYVIGLGPGKEELMSQEALATIADCEIIVGYSTYMRLILDLVVLIGIAALAFLSFRVAGGDNFGGGSGQTYTVYANFTDIGGLKVKAPIKASGVLVGRVQNITLDPATYQAKVTL